MSLSKTYKRDKTRTWIAVDSQFEVELGYFSVRSPEYQAVFTKNIMPVRKLAEKNMLPPAKDREIAIKTFVEACCFDWRTVTPDGYRNEVEFEDGVWLPFTRENAVKVFVALPDLYNEVIDVARELSNFQLTDDERKNSGNV